MSIVPHPDLQQLRTRLTEIHNALEHFKPLTPRPPILDSSFDTANEASEENQWLHQENIPGLTKLKEHIKIDLGILDKFLDDPQCANLPPLSTNAPYVIAVWNEVLCAPLPVVSVFKSFLLDPSMASTSRDKSKKRAVTQPPPAAKVDVVADNGRRWIRVNTIKNSRLHSEFREIDSYLTDSEGDSDDEDWDDNERPSLAQSQFDNSILRMGRSLLQAAASIEGSTEIPKITLRLTRLNPEALNDIGTPPDPRIRQTLDLLGEMGIDVALGERQDNELPPVESYTSRSVSPTATSINYTPTLNINLDLSVLIALISDLTHAPLPQDVDEANKRFVPPPEYREWKQKRLAMTGKPQKVHSLLHDGQDSPSPDPVDINDLPRDLIKHARALTNQLLQEMGKGLLQEMHDKISSASASGNPTVRFWTTAEARERCLRIVSKIGGVHEKRRARALFRLGPSPPNVDSAGAEPPELSLEEAAELYWQNSRFSNKFVPLLPIRILPPSASTSTTWAYVSTNQLDFEARTNMPTSDFGLDLAKVCTDILAQETIPHPRALPDELISSSSSSATVSDTPPHTQPEIQRATVTKASPRLTAHTVQSMRWGAELGWTTLTANRTSVKAILRELKSARVAGRLAGANANVLLDGGGEGEAEGVGRDCSAAIWLVDPRSLAEGMSSLPSAR